MNKVTIDDAAEMLVFENDGGEKFYVDEYEVSNSNSALGHMEIELSLKEFMEVFRIYMRYRQSKDE